MGRRWLSTLALALVSQVALAADEPITLTTATGVIQGTLSMPRTDRKLPVALIIAGSGPTDRNGNNPLIKGNNDSLKMLADALAQAGIASVRFDKRGIGMSADPAVRESDLRFETYVEDAAEWVSVLNGDARFSGVAVIGHSEGALIGMLAAARSPVKAYVSIAGSGVGLADNLRHQLAGNLMGELAARNEAILTSLRQGRVVDDVPAPLQALYRPSVQPYLISSFRYLPQDEIRKLRVPCLILQGDTDIQVTIADANALKAAKPDAQEHVVHGMNHVLKQVPPEPARQRASYGDPTLPLDMELSEVLVNFLHASITDEAGIIPGQRHSE